MKKKGNFRGVNKSSDSFLTQRGEVQWKENDITKQYDYLNVSFQVAKKKRKSECSLVTHYRQLQSADLKESMRGRSKKQNICVFTGLLHTDL